MTRLNNIVLSYLIVECYEKKCGLYIDRIKLINYIKTKTGVTDMTASEYINTLLRGIYIERKRYQIIFVSGGYKTRGDLDGGNAKAGDNQQGQAISGAARAD